MQIGLGILRLPPSEFWKMTMCEFWAAHTGYMMTVAGSSKPKEGQVATLWIEPPSKEEIAEIKRVHKVA